MSEADCPPTNSSLVGNVLTAAVTYGGKAGGFVGGIADNVTFGITDGYGAKAGEYIGPVVFAGPIAYGACALHLFGSCDHEPSKANINMVNSIITSAIYESLQAEHDSGVTTQHMLANCTDPSKFRDNAGCLSCLNVRDELMSRRYALEQEALQISGDGDAVSLPNTYIQSLWNNFEPCEYACVSCGVGNSQQNSTIKIGSSFQASSTFTTSVRNKIKTASAQAVKNVSDMTGDLARAIKSDQACMSQDLSNRINNNISDKQIADVVNQSKVFQEINISGRSIWADRLEQGITAQTMSTYVGSLNVANKMYTSSEMKASQELVESNANFKELVNDLDQVIVSLSDIYKSTVGKTLIIVGTICIAVILIMLIYMVQNPAAADEMFDRATTRVNSAIGRG